MVTPVNWNMKYACMYIVIKIVEIYTVVLFYALQIKTKTK